MGNKLNFTAEKSERAVTFLANAVAGLSRAGADRLIKSGEVRINGVRVKSNAVIEAGDVVSVFVPDSVRDNDPAVRTVYEDDNIAVFDKPKRVSYDRLPEIYGAPLFAVHRLDTNTTGLIVFAKTENIRRELDLAFRERRVQKIYEAVVFPAPQKDSDTLTAYIKLMPSVGVATVSDKPKEGYKTMITEYSVIKRFRSGCALVRVLPHTGRTHQIRAHFMFIGCPIVGEHKYGIRGITSPPGAPDSQMLAAAELMFSGLKGKAEYLNGMSFKTDSDFDLSFAENAGE